MNNNKGFTIIEMMMALVIMTILAIAAVPTYRTYITKTRLMEAFTMTSNIKVAMVEYYNTHGHFPETNADIGMKELPHSQYIQELNIKKPINHNSDKVGYIEVTLKSMEQTLKTGQKMFLVATVENGGVIKWGCGTIDSSLYEYMPYDCVELEQP